MRVTLAAVGRAKAGPLRDLYDLYRGRLAWPFTLIEVEERRPLRGEELKAREGALLLAAVPARARLIALDENGRSRTSADFARLIGQWQDEGVKDLAFAIGGAEGLSAGVIARAELVLSLGVMTWPHLLVRALLTEQLYRAETILAGHPYHRP